MKQSGKKVVGLLILLVIAALYYYITIPAINIHSTEFWIFIFAFVLILAGWYAWKKKIEEKNFDNRR